MPIPPLNEAGLLPPGIHACGVEDVRSRFGSFQTSDRRPHLMQRLDAFLAEVRACRIVRAVIVNGSFVTSKPAPEDIDLLLVLPAGHDFHAELSPNQYMVVDGRRVRRAYGLDAFVVEEGSADYEALVQLFAGCACNPVLRKAL